MTSATRKSGATSGVISEANPESPTEQTPERVKVLIVDDHPMVREGLTGILERQHIQITGLAATGRQALEMYFARRPDVMLLDLRLSDQSGFDVVRAVLKAVGVEKVSAVLGF